MSYRPISSPRRINKVVAGILDKTLSDRGVVLRRIIIEWPSLADSAATWSEPSALRFVASRSPSTGEEGILDVSIRSGRGLEMQMLAPEIIDRCNQSFGYNLLSRIAIKQMSPNG